MNRIQELIQQYAVSQDKTVMFSIIEELQQSEQLWVAYSPVTKNHYVEYHNEIPTAFLFSEAGFCQAFRQYLATKNIRMQTMECGRAVRISMFSDFFRNGIDQVIVDNGQRFVVIRLTDILNRPDFSAVPEAQRPVMNPELMRKANLFFQSQDAKEKNPSLAVRFMKELYQSKFLLPLFFSGRPPKGTVLRSMTFGGTSLAIPVISRPEGGCYIPVFTDWIEFSKMDTQKICVGNVVTFEDLAQLCAAGEVIAVNPLGFHMIVDQTTVQALTARFGKPAAPSAGQAVHQPVARAEEESAVPSAGQTVHQPVAPQQPAFEFFELTRVPNPMIMKLYEWLKRTPGIKSAYLRGLRQNGQDGYLCIVDFSDTDPAVFQQMAQEVGPLTGGLALNFVSYNSDFGRTAVGRSIPFYTR